MGALVSSTNKTDRHDITEILLKVALNTNNHSPQFCFQVTEVYSTLLIGFRTHIGSHHGRDRMVIGFRATVVLNPFTI
jgi:hypothetical protein